MVVRLLSFDPMVRMTEPPEMIQLIRERIRRQRELITVFPEKEKDTSV